MNLSKNQILEIVGVVGVICSLLFLSYEIRQSNQIARTTVAYEISNNYAQLNEIIWTDQNVAALRLKSMNPDFQPTDIERIQLLAEMRRFNNVWLAIENAYNNGQLGQVQFDTAMEDVRSVVTTLPGLRSIWLESLEDYPSLAENYQLIAYLESLLKEQFP